MVRHVVMFRFVEGTTDAQIGQVAAGLSQMSTEIASIRAYSHGRDLKLGSDRYDYAIVADFDDLEGWREYDEHPLHNKLRADVIRPLITERAWVQFECLPATV